MASNETIGSSIPSTETTKFPFPGCVVFQNEKVRHDFNNTAGEKEKKGENGVRTNTFHLA